MPNQFLNSLGEPIYDKYKWILPDCYIYLYHTDEYFVLPQYPEQVSDTMQSTFGNQNALSRTAPVYSYVNSGPREVQIGFKLHRDMMRELNCENASIKMNQGDDVIIGIDDDYIDIMLKKLQSIALPRYRTSDKTVDPPRVAVRIGHEFFVKGVIEGGIGLSYGLPILDNGKYATVDFSFKVSETQPYDADTVGRLGNFRGLTSGLRTKIGLSSNQTSAQAVAGHPGRAASTLERDNYSRYF